MAAHPDDCASARAALSRLRAFVAAESTKRLVAGRPVGTERDDAFLSLAETALSTCDPVSVQRLLDEMRGLSHYFAAYCEDLHVLDRLVDDLYVEARNVLLNDDNGDTFVVDIQIADPKSPSVHIGASLHSRSRSRSLTTADRRQHRVRQTVDANQLPAALDAIYERIAEWIQESGHARTPVRRSFELSVARESDVCLAVALAATSKSPINAFTLSPGLL